MMIYPGEISVPPKVLAQLKEDATIGGLRYVPLDEHKRVRFNIVDSRGSPWWRMARSFLFASCCFFPGVFLESEPMQWLGFAAFILTGCVSLKLAMVRDRKDMTIEEARAHLDEMEA